MKGFRMLFVLLVIGTAALMYLGYSSKLGSTSSNPGVVSISSREAMTTTMIRRRKLMIKGEIIDSPKDVGDQEDAATTVNASLEDYGVVDPVPSSTTSIRPGPIQHGTPLLPYIPEPSPPPTQPKKTGGLS